MKSIAALITDLETKLPFIAHHKESVSQASVGWHLEHSLLALIKMISAVEHSNPADYKWTFNLKRMFVLLTNKFPRGRAKAPATVLPGDEINEATIRPLLEKARQKAELFEKLNKDHFFNHPVFGGLRLKKALRIVAIHTYHHIKIMNEIINGE